MRKNRLPDHINAAMKQYNAAEGMLPLPSSYIYHHKALAEMELAHRERLSDLTAKEDGKRAYFKVIETAFVNDGWCDGFYAVQAVVAVRETLDREWTLKTIKWDTSFAWFEKSESGGWLRWQEALASTVDYSPTMTARAA